MMVKFKMLKEQMLLLILYALAGNYYLLSLLHLIF